MDYVCKIDKDAIEYCEEVLNETVEKRVNSLRELREWVADKPHLNVPTDAYNILRFLRAAKFDIEAAKNKITSFYSFKSSAPEWFANQDPLLPELQSLLKTGVFLPLRQRDSEGRLVVLLRVAAHDPAIQKQDDVYKIGTMVLDLALLEEDTSVYGVAAIFDMDGFSLRHARELTLRMITRTVSSWKIYPVRMRTLDCVNPPCYMNVVINIFRSLMTQKLKDRIHVHKDKDALHSVIPKEILPEEYGGSGGKLQDLIDYWHKKVSDSRAWFLENEKCKANTT